MNTQSRNMKRPERLWGQTGKRATAALILLYATGCATTTIHTQQGQEKSDPAVAEAGAKKEPEKKPAQDEKKNCATESKVVAVKSENPAGEKAAGEKPAGEKAAGEKASGEKPAARERGAGEQPEKKVATRDDNSYFENAGNEKAETDNIKPQYVAYHTPAQKMKDAGGEEAPKKEKLFTDPGNEEFHQVGTASWYGRDFDGRKTANGDMFDSRKLTAAHKELPLGSIVLVRNLENNKEVVLRINDRGPFVKGRVLDISEYGAERLDYKEKGLTTVGIKIIRRGEGKALSPGATRSVYGEDEKSDKRDTKAVNEKDDKSDKKEISEKDEKSDGEETNVNGDAKKKIRVEKTEYKPENSLQAFSVQVGVFENEYNAAALKHALEKYNLPLHILKRGSLYVLKIGNFDKRAAAEELRAKLNDAGFTAFVSEP